MATFAGVTKRAPPPAATRIMLSVVVPQRRRSASAVVSWEDNSERRSTCGTIDGYNHRHRHRIHRPYSDPPPLSSVGRTTIRRHVRRPSRCSRGIPSLSSSSSSSFSSSSSSLASSSSSSSSSSIPEEIAALVNEYAQKPQTSVSLQTLMRTGRGDLLSKTYKDEVVGAEQGQLEQKAATERILMQVASFLRRELPIRLAHRIHDLDNVPMMGDMQSVRDVKDIYVNSFMELIGEPIIDSASREAEFADKLGRLYENHSNILIQMARGAFELRKAVRRGDVEGLMAGGNHKSNVVEFERMDELHSFLDRFYMSRIGIRVLAGQYLALRHPPLEDYIGMIYQRTSPHDIVCDAVEDAKVMCDRKFGHSPEVVICGRLDLTFPYVPTHLHYILLELLKNAMRATVEKHGVDGDEDDWPPVYVIIADGKENEDVVIKVSDEGGGIPRSYMRKIWSYLFTTADPSIQEGLIAFSGEVDHGVDSPLAGLGYGLPISRSYARYFGGEVSVMSMEGYGTDAFVYLTRLGNSREALPL